MNYCCERRICPDINNSVSFAVTALSGIRQDDVLPPLPPERFTEHLQQRFVFFSSLCEVHLVETKQSMKRIDKNLK